MELLIAILFYLHLITPDQHYNTLYIQKLEKENYVRIEQVKAEKSPDELDRLVEEVPKTVWDHEEW